MDFTREPIIETIITTKDGYKLVVRNSKGAGQEDYFVDAVEVVSFGHSFFFRSLERPKSFLVPVTDYEILEVKETRVVLKQPISERFSATAKSTNANSKENFTRNNNLTREPIANKADRTTQRVEKPEKTEPVLVTPGSVEDEELTSKEELLNAEEGRSTLSETATVDPRLDRRRDRKRYRRRRGRGERDVLEDDAIASIEESSEGDYLFSDKSLKNLDNEPISNLQESEPSTPNILASSEEENKGPKAFKPSHSMLIPPPTTLISETIHQYKDILFTKPANSNSREESDSDPYVDDSISPHTYDLAEVVGVNPLTRQHGSVKDVKFFDNLDDTSEDLEIQQTEQPSKNSRRYSDGRDRRRRERYAPQDRPQTELDVYPPVQEQVEEKKFQESASPDTNLDSKDL